MRGYYAFFLAFLICHFLLLLKIFYAKNNRAVLKVNSIVKEKDTAKVLIFKLFLFVFTIRINRIDCNLMRI